MSDQEVLSHERLREIDRVVVTDLQEVHGGDMEAVRRARDIHGGADTLTVEWEEFRKLKGG